MDLLERIERNLREECLLAADSAILAGISGGVDSMVLLDLLHRLSAKHRWSIHVAHFNHQLRGPESDGDEQFVAERARAMRLPFIAGRGDVSKRAGEAGISLEMAARELRHQFFAQSARVSKSSQIVLAHHADDQVETFWMRLLRGDVGAGLGGMRWRRASPAAPDISLLRPLLDIPKSELLAYARERSLPFREDSSNAHLDFQRNRLRREILPLLESFQPELRAITLRAARSFAAEKDFLNAQALAWLRKADRPFHFLYEALQREIIRAQLLDLQVNPSFELIESLRTRQDKPVTVAPDSVVWRDCEGRIKSKVSAPAEFEADEKRIDLATSGQQEFHALQVEWETASTGSPRPARRRTGQPGRLSYPEQVEVFDAEKVGPFATLRFWRPGDRFTQIGMQQSIKLQDLFTNLKIPAAERRRRLIATAADGEIFWVQGLRIGEACKVTERTRHFLNWRWMRTA